MQINNILSINEQESFMHLIFDVIHNDVGIGNLEFRLKNLCNKYGDLKNILNSRMKNEKYSNSFDIPIMKVIFETKNHILNESELDFKKRKMDVINLFKKHGATLNILNEKYMDENPYFEFKLRMSFIDKELYNMILYESNNKIIITI